MLNLKPLRPVKQNEIANKACLQNNIRNKDSFKPGGNIKSYSQIIGSSNADCDECTDIYNGAKKFVAM